MLHPVLPPDPPPILKPLQTANPVSSVSDTKSASGVETGTILNIGKSKHHQDLAQLTIADKTKNDLRSPTSPDSTDGEVLGTETPSVPEPPKTFPPEFSSLTVSKSAALLGKSIEIGYPRQEIQISNVNQKEDTQLSERSDTETQEYRAREPEISQALQQRSPNPDTTEEKQTSLDSPLPASPTPRVPASSPRVSAPSSQSIQNLIQFKSRNPTNKLSAPLTVEFYSQTQAPAPTTTPQVDTTNPPQTPAASPQTAAPRIVEVTSDRQEYDEQRRIITAVGKVVVRFDGAVVDADRLQVNLDNLIAAGEGNVTLTRGDQVLRGQRFTYNFVQDSGELQNGRGEIYVPSANTDLAFSSTDITSGGVSRRPASDRILANQPLSGVSSSGGIDISFGGQDASNVPPPKAGGAVKRLRFEAQQIDFYPQGWQARDVRITNDPFSPPELELRADTVTLTRESPLVDRIRTRGQRLVLDQTIALPIPVNEQTIDRRERDATPFIVSPGYDGEDRGGFYVERGFRVIDTERTRWTITPQLLVQRAFEQGVDNFGSVFGVRSRINSVLGPKTTIQGNGELTSFDLDDLENSFRANLGLRQTLGDRLPHILNVQYNYRDRLYNGTLGFQTVQSSFGGIITSPIIPLGKSGVNLSYQGSAQYIDANTDRLDLLEPVRDNDRISLGRLQASAELSTTFLLWAGKALPPTSSEGLRYTATPVVPYLVAIAGVTGTTSYYTNGDNQSTLTGRIGLQGQVGNFSRPFFDYTAFNLSYSQGLNNGLSPFLFDRSVDNKILSAGITQQIYGPIRLGFQTSINLDTGKEVSTDYIVEYSRRTYGITLRYNPVLELGAFSFRISDFNWNGGSDPFSEVKPVVGGVQQNY
ncbi:MAG: DUF3769 domain-containing protein [Nostoc sp. ChiSLP02]|nr:DUF3769 domain-containing protein [Nostoc sp. DedSLP05]MDZ8103178.1 DUF3769 domain-containing protein [Nostoc sp. DedSLP01]MDZ8188071.1 DUF3769 domain-containing protein [Nostoc sp. ChiSLP02]